MVEAQGRPGGAEVVLVLFPNRRATTPEGSREPSRTHGRTGMWPRGASQVPRRSVIPRVSPWRSCRCTHRMRRRPVVTADLPRIWRIVRRLFPLETSWQIERSGA